MIDRDHVRPFCRAELILWLESCRSWAMRLSEYYGYPSSSIPEVLVLSGPGDRVIREVVRRDTLRRRLDFLLDSMRRLPVAERIVLRYRYFDQAAISWICYKTWLREWRVRQLLDEALNHLYAIMREEPKPPGKTSPASPSYSNGNVLLCC